MKKAGFTLIEILVTVLIIGILGAIALPQYQRALLKSRYAALMPIAKSMADSNEAYYLEHGIYADDPQDLLVQGQRNYPSGTELNFGTSSDYSYVLATNQNETPNNVYVTYQKHSKNFPGNIHCEAADNNELATWLCRDALHGTPINTGEIKSLSGEGYTAYLLSGSTAGSTFDRSCEGPAPTLTEPCESGCGVMTSQAVCNPQTGEWDPQGYDSSSCPAPLEDETVECGTGFTGNKTRSGQCNAAGTAFEYGEWDTSACVNAGRTYSSTCSPAPSNNYCTGNNTFTGSAICWSGGYSNTCNNNTFEGTSKCMGSGNMVCLYNTFKTGATCRANSAKAGIGCQYNTFDGGTCLVEYGGGKTNGCSFNTFTNGAKCRAQDNKSGGAICAGNTYTNNSRCYATPDYGISSSCGAAENGTPSTYDATSCCVANSGGSCPAGTSCAEKGLPDNP